MVVPPTRSEEFWWDNRMGFIPLQEGVIDVVLLGLREAAKNDYLAHSIVFLTFRAHFSLSSVSLASFSIC